MRALKFLNTNKSRFTAGFLLALFLIFVFVYSEHRKSRITAAETRASGLASVAGWDPVSLWQGNGLLARTSSNEDQARREPAFSQKDTLPQDRMVVVTVESMFLVQDPDKVVEETRALAARLGGYVSSLHRTKDGANAAYLELRIPVTRFDEARKSIESSAIKKQSEKLTTEDVTKQFVDTEAQIRNLKAQEAQYLQIMRGAAKITDVLAVTEKLEEVRGEIESLQASANYLKHQSALATLTIAFVTETPVVVAGFEWKPSMNARLAWVETQKGLAAWVDTAVGFLLYLPVLLLWTLSIAGIIVAGWKILVLLKRLIERWFPQATPVEPVES